MKRFTDTDLWSRAWFMDMDAPEKTAFMYIKDQCDCVGVWPVNMALLRFMTGYDGSLRDLLTKCNGNLELLPGWEEDTSKAKVWLPDFCDFQYGQLTEKSPPHRKYIQLLKKYRLLQRVSKGYQRGFNTPQEEEEEEEEEKEKEEEEEEESARHAKAISDQLRIIIDNASGGNIHPGKLKVEYDILRSWAKGLGIGDSELLDTLTFAATSKGTNRPLTGAKVITFEYGKIRAAALKGSSVPAYTISDEEIERRYPGLRGG